MKDQTVIRDFLGTARHSNGFKEFMTKKALNRPNFRPSNTLTVDHRIIIHIILHLDHEIITHRILLVTPRCAMYWRINNSAHRSLKDSNADFRDAASHDWGTDSACIRQVASSTQAY